MGEAISLLWVRREGGVYRVWITHAVVPAPRGDQEVHSIHFADPEWREVGSAPVDPSTELDHLREEEMESLLARAIGGR